MSKIGGRSCIPVALWSCLLVTLLGLGMAGAQHAAASDEDIPPLRQDESALRHYASLEDGDFGYSPAHTLPSAQPFDRIAFEVIGPYIVRDHAIERLNAEIGRLDEFARAVMLARLWELGVADEIKLSLLRNELSQLDPASACRALRVRIAYNAVKQTIDGRELLAMAGTSLLSQNAEGYAKSGKQECLVFGPARLRVSYPVQFIMPSDDSAAIVERCRQEIIRFVDYEVVPLILRVHDVARLTVRSWRQRRISTP